MRHTRELVGLLRYRSEVVDVVGIIIIIMVCIVLVYPQYFRICSADFFLAHHLFLLLFSIRHNDYDVKVLNLGAGQR